jgi:hypothetical protein
MNNKFRSSIDMNGFSVKNSKLLKQTLTPSGTTQTINWSSGDYVDLVLTSASGNVTLTLNNPNSPCAYIIKLTQGATPRNVIFPSGTKQGGGVSGNTVYGVASVTQMIYVIYDSIYYVNVDTFE